MPIAMPLLVSIPDEKLYPLVGAVVPAWILLMLAPRWRWTKRTALLSLLIVSALQLALVSTPIRKMGVVGLMERMLTYQSMVKLMKETGGLLTWAHYAASDLGCGMWMLSDSYARGVHHLFMIPQLLVAFAFPPAGMVLYLLITRPLLSTRRGTKGLPRTNWKKE